MQPEPALCRMVLVSRHHKCVAALPVYFAPKAKSANFPQVVTLKMVERIARELVLKLQRLSIAAQTLVADRAIAVLAGVTMLVPVTVIVVRTLLSSVPPQSLYELLLLECVSKTLMTFVRQMQIVTLADVVANFASTLLFLQESLLVSVALLPPPLAVVV